MLRLGLQSLTVTRQTAGSWVDGDWVDGASTETLTIRGSIQPMGLRELELFPEGERHREQRKLYSETELKVAELDTPRTGDIVSYAGKSWRVHGLTTYDELTGATGKLAHWKYRLVKIGVDEQ